jgi:hypothetical protein
LWGHHDDGTEFTDMEARAELIQRQLSHLDAARRLREGMKTYGRLRGLERSANYHQRKAATLAQELAGGLAAAAR